MKQKQTEDTTPTEDTNVYQQHNESNHQELCNEYKILMGSCSYLDLCKNVSQLYKNVVDCLLVRQNTDYITPTYDYTSEVILCKTLALHWDQHLMNQEWIKQAQ